MQARLDLDDGNHRGRARAGERRDGPREVGGRGERRRRLDDRDGVEPVVLLERVERMADDVDSKRLVGRELRRAIEHDHVQADRLRRDLGVLGGERDRLEAARGEGGF